MTKMKKILAVGLASVLAVSFAACSKGAADDTQTDAAAVKTGLAVVSEIQDVTETTLTIDSIAAAVLVDADGKIVDVKLDEAQTAPDLEQDNGDVADLRTKLEKKEDYGMKAVSEANGIGKEWYEQAAAFETWAKGKTADEVKAGVGEDGYASDADLKAGCTIHASGFATAVANAVANAQDLGAVATDTLKLAVTTEKNQDSNETNLQYDSNYAVVTLDADGKITSCLIDSSMGKCSIENGKFTVAAGAFITKKEMKEDYGMKAVSEANGIGKEWYEQAAAFEAWAIGKTAADLTAGIGEDGYASDADLKAGCTIYLNSITTNVVKAATV